MRSYVVFVHGIGEQKQDSYAEFADRINLDLEEEVQRSGNYQPGKHAFFFEEAYWADITQPDQERMKSEIGTNGRLRDFVIGSLGDATAYSKMSYPPDKYGEIQNRFAETIEKLSWQAKQAGETQAPLTVIGHSLGSVIASDALYDMSKNDKMPQNMKLVNFITLGSPIALYGLRYGLENFDKPVQSELWLNFYYPQDILAYPLKFLNAAYDSAVTEDIPLSPGGGVGFPANVARLLTAKMPLVGMKCHNWYFSDKRVVRRIAQALSANQTL